MANLESIQQNHQLTRLRSLSRYIIFSRSDQIAIYYLLALALAEEIAAVFAPLLGLAMYSLIFVVLLLHSSLVNNGRQRRFLLALALLPLIRLLSLSLPLAVFPKIYRYVVIGAPLFVGVLITARTAGLNFSMTGLTLCEIPPQIPIVLEGIGLGYLEYWILRPAPMVSGFSLKLAWLPALILLVFTGFLEELIFRGVLQYAALRRLGRFGIPYVAILYAVFYLGYYSVPNILFIFCVALAFGVITARSGSILGVSLSHGLANIFLYLVFPFLFATPIAQGPFTQVTLIPANVRLVTPTKFIAASFQTRFRPMDIRVKIAPGISDHNLVATIKTFIASMSYPTITCVLTCSRTVPLLSSNLNIWASYTDMPPPLAVTPTIDLSSEESHPSNHIF